MTALPACIEDAKEECASNEILFELARKNTQNTIKALVEPLLKHDSRYILKIVDERGNIYE